MKVLLWLIILSTQCTGIAVTQPPLLKGSGIATTTPTKSEVIALFKQAGPILEAAERRAGHDPCTSYVDFDDLKSTSSSLKGSFTRKGADQKVIRIEYCGFKYGVYSLIGIFEKGKLLSAMAAEDIYCAIGIEKYPDLNMNGTDELMIHIPDDMFCNGDNVNLTDFYDGKTNKIAVLQIPANTSDCVYADKTDLNISGITHEFYAFPAKNPVIYESVFTSKCAKPDINRNYVKKLAKIGSPPNQDLIYLDIDTLNSTNVFIPDLFIGNFKDFINSRTCKNLNCSIRGTYNFPGDIVFTNYNVNLGSKYDDRGICVFQVDGINRMIGFFGGERCCFVPEDLVGVNKSIVSQLVHDATNQELPSESNEFFISQDIVEPTFRMDKNASLDIHFAYTLSNLTSQPIKHGIYSVVYVSEKKYADRLRSFINRTPSDADILSAKNAFLAILNGKLVKSDKCEAKWTSKSLSKDDLWKTYFSIRGFDKMKDDPEADIEEVLLPGLAGRPVNDIFTIKEGNCLW